MHVELLLWVPLLISTTHVNLGLSNPWSYTLEVDHQLGKTIYKLRLLFCWIPENSIGGHVYKPQLENSNKHSTHSVLMYSYQVAVVTMNIYNM